MKYNEIWKSIKDYDNYEVSNFGRVKSIKRIDTNNHPLPERILKQSRHKTGYMLTTLCKNGINKTFWTARIIAKTFIINPDNKKEVNHINERVNDNRSINLEWVTSKENCNYGRRTERATTSRLKQVFQYDKNNNIIHVWASTKETIMGGFNQGNVSACCIGKRKTHKNFIWSYKKVGDQNFI